MRVVYWRKGGMGRIDVKARVGASARLAFMIRIRNKRATKKPLARLFYMARGQRFELRLTGSEPVVLPLDDPRMRC